MKTLTLLPTSASALAAAPIGDEAVVRVAVEKPTPNLPGRDWQYEVSEGNLLYVARRGRSKSVHLVEPPAAVGERVALRCPGCLGERIVMERRLCFDCKGAGTLPATVTAAPEPEAFCETCNNEAMEHAITAEMYERDRAEYGDLVPDYAEEYNKLADCPTCHGTPSTWVWRVGVRRERA